MDVCVENKCLPWISFLRSEGIFHKVIKDLKGPKNQIYILNNLEKFRHLLSKSKDNRVFIINERFKKEFGKTSSYPLEFSKSTFDIDLKKKNNITISFTKLNNHLLIFFELRLESLLSHGKQTLKKISLSEDFKCYTYEKLCSINKNNVRKYQKEIIKMAFFYLKKPLVYLWKYPYLYKNVFNLRIDVDPDISREDVNLAKIKNTFKQLDEYSDCVTFVLNFFRRAPNFYFFKNFIKKFDIQSHNFFHCLYPDRRINEKNFLLADYILKKMSIKPHGFICPEYFWYSHTADILEKYNYKYNHSFGFDFSSYSHRPIVSGKIRDYFEVPCSPLVYSKYENAVNLTFKDSILELYEQSIISNINKVHTPCFIYEHPGIVGLRNEIINKILKTATSLKNIMPITLTNWVKWLAEREKTLFDLSYVFNNGKLEFNKTNINSKFSIAIEKENSKKIELVNIKKYYERKKNNYLSIEPIKSNFNETFNNNDLNEISFFRDKSHRKKIVKNYFYYFKYKMKKFYL